MKKINLALQGGGAHGAFAWGVLDKLLDDERIEVEAICATSAGTMNACAFAYGLHKGGRKEAKACLHEFWRNMYTEGLKFNPIKNMPWEPAFWGLGNLFGDNGWNKDNSLSFLMFDTLSRSVSPYQLNPFNINPLRDVLEKSINFHELRHCQKTKLFISATHVKTGKVRVFNTQQVSIDVVMASACLPFVFKAVEVEGEDFWDGGYMGNPALFPVFYATDSRDLLVVHINPLEREETPHSAPDIMNRINEISFNSSLIHEMRAIAFVKKLIEKDMLKDEFKNDFKDVLMHAIRADEHMKELSVASKFNTDWNFLLHLRDKGREAMQAWLDKHYSSLGNKDTVDLHSEFLYSVNRMFK